MKLVVALLALTAQAAAQVTFLPEPVEMWKGTISPVGAGNECKLSPAADPLLICTSLDASVWALRPSTSTAGAEDLVWSYQPTALNSISSKSGLTFSSDGAFMVYGTSDTTGTDSTWYVCTRGG